MRRTKKPEAPRLAELYPISVVIPFYARADQLRKCLQGLLENDLENTEILLVDDASPEDPTEVVRSLADAERIHVIRQDRNRGPAASRNAGLAAAAHDWILFLDADVVLPAQGLGWIRETLQLYCHRSDVSGVLGLYSDEIPGGDFWSNYKNLVTCHLYHVTDTISPYLHTPMFCVRKAVLESAGGFDVRFATAEDFRLGVLLGSQGHRFIIDRRIRGVHLKEYHLAAILKEDRRRLHDLSRLGLRGDQRAFAVKAHRFTRLAAVLLPGASLLSTPLMMFDLRWGFVTLALLLAFVFVTYPQIRYFRKKRGIGFAWKARAFLFLEMLWAEGCVIETLPGQIRRRLTSRVGS